MNNNNAWILFAFLSAFFAALTSILVKIGIQNVNSNLATAIVFITGKHNDIVNIEQKNLLFLF